MIFRDNPVAQFGHNNSDDMPAELLDLAKKSTVLLRRIYETQQAETGQPQAAE